ncbi:hypothetical protein K502DRAFT_176897 [Neoconidiobolus thromboides FSU 785]|nr:hypothetical protein K502DRAFT_176897 [Neoconidiobolus thromboides FSU 785]
METIKQKRAQTITPKLPGLVIVCNERLEELLELSKIYMQEIDFYLDVQAGDIDVEDLKKNKAKIIERAEKLSGVKFKKEIANNEKKREYERMKYWVENLEKGGVVNKEILREMLIFKSKKDYLEIENKRKANKEALLKTEVKIHELERKKERYDLLVQRIGNTKWETNDSGKQSIKYYLDY